MCTVITLTVSISVENQGIPFPELTRKLQDLQQNCVIKVVICFSFLRVLMLACYVTADMSRVTLEAGVETLSGLPAVSVNFSLNWGCVCNL